MKLPPNFNEHDFVSLEPLEEVNENPDIESVGNRLIGENPEGLNKEFRKYGYAVTILELRRTDGQEAEYPVYLNSKGSD